jgi:proline iminopeptidase
MVNIDETNKVWTQKMGSGERNLLLLHGGPGATHEYFENFPDYLDTNKYTIYFYDQLGSYFSDNTDLKDLWELDRFVEEVETVRKALGISELYLLGHSWGGILAIHYAAKYPQQLKGLVLSNSPFTSYGAFSYQNGLFKNIKRELKSELGRKPNREEVDLRFNEIHRYGMDTIPEVFTRLENHYNRDSKRWETAFFRQKKWNLENRAKEIVTRTLIIGGGKDFIDPNDFTLMNEAIVNSHLVILPNSPHFPMWCDSKNYFAAIDEFLTDETN